MRVNCQKCAKSYKMDAKALGKKVRCKCGHKFVATESDVPRDAPPPIPNAPKNKTQDRAPNQTPNVSEPPATNPHAALPPSSSHHSADTPLTYRDSPSPATPTIVVSNQPTRATSKVNPSVDRKSGASSKWVWIGSLGGFAGILVIVLIVVAMRKKPIDEQSVRQNEKQASEQQTDNEDPKDRNNPGNSNKGFSGSDKKPEKSVPLKNKTDDTSATSNSKKNSRNKQQNTIPDPASKLDPIIFEPDLVTEIELPDWKIDEETDLAQVVQSFMNSSGNDREKNEERLIRAGAPACPLIAAKIRAVENDRQRLLQSFP